MFDWNVNLFRFRGPAACQELAPASGALLVIPFHQSKQWAVLWSACLLQVFSHSGVFLEGSVVRLEFLELYKEKLIAFLAMNPFPNALKVQQSLCRGKMLQTKG